jgi:dihydroneopterin aldolase
MRFYAHHGCFQQERAIGTHFTVDIVFNTDTSRAEQSDNIADTVSYLDVYQIVKREMQQPSNLLEHVARRVGEAVLKEFPAVTDIKVKVSKMNPPLGGQMHSVSVELDLKA